MSEDSLQGRRDPKRYERIKLIVGMVNLVVYVAVPAVVLFTGASASIRDVVSDMTGGIVVVGAVAYIAVGSIALEVVTLPLGFFLGMSWSVGMGCLGARCWVGRRIG